MISVCSKKIAILFYIVACWAFPSLSSAAELPVIEVANRIADALEAGVRERTAGGVHRIAVMTFSNTEGGVKAQDAEPAVILQGAIKDALKAKALPNVLMVDLRTMNRDFRDSGVDPRRLEHGDPQPTAEALSELGWSAVLTGQIQVIGDELKVDYLLTFSDGHTLQPPGSTSPRGNADDPNNLDFDPSSGARAPGETKFRVDILVDGQPLDLLVNRTPSSEFHNVYFTVVPSEWVEQNKPYSIRIKTVQAEEQLSFYRIGPRAEVKPNRLYAAAVLVDGISSISSSVRNASGGTSYDFESGPPFKLPKWILANPGYRVGNEPAGAQGTVAAVGQRASNGRDGATVQIPGFQVNNAEAGQFEFGSTGSGDVFAELIGVTHDIGLISVYFFAEKFEGDRMSQNHPLGSGIGTRFGEPVANPIRRLKLELNPDAVEVWRIFYRRDADELPVPIAELVPAP